MEMMMTSFFGDKLLKAVQDGFVPEARINDAALRIVRTILAFDRDHKEYDMSVVGCREHTELARKVAEKGITLIKNQEVLPFSKSKTKTLALIGKLGNSANIGDHGSSMVRPAYVVTPLEGLTGANPGSKVIYNDGSDLESAKEDAKRADAVVFVVGYDHSDEGEFVSTEDADNYLGGIGGDRKESLGLHEDEIRLLQEVLPVNDNHAVVLIGGNMIMMTEWYDAARSVLMAYYPGQEGGTAIAEILYGDVNPSGKLPYVIPYCEKDLPYVNWEAADQYYEYYHGYTRLDKNGVKPLAPYGFGLSYTSFETGVPQVQADDENLIVKVNVINTGDREGDEVVQVYAGYENSRIDRPLRQLCGFHRVSLKSGEEKTVEITVPVSKLMWYNPTYRRWELEKMEYTIYAGTSEATEDLRETKVFLG